MYRLFQALCQPFWHVCTKSTKTATSMNSTLKFITSRGSITQYAIVYPVPVAPVEETSETHFVRDSEWSCVQSMWQSSTVVSLGLSYNSSTISAIRGKTHTCGTCNTNASQNQSLYLHAVCRWGREL